MFNNLFCKIMEKSKKLTNSKRVQQKVDFYMSLMRKATYFYNNFCNDVERSAILDEYERLLSLQDEQLYNQLSLIS